MDKIHKDDENSLLINYIELSDEFFHDFKNILANISGLTQLSILKAEDKELKINLNDIYKATSEFAEALIRYQKLIHGDNKREKTVHSLEEILKKAFSMVKFRFVEGNMGSNIRLVVNFKSDSKVLCNSYELNHVLLNIIRNGIDAMEEEGGTLTLSVYNKGDLVCTIIKDTGMGISEENMENIFNNAFTTKINGSGLGLKIAKEVIEDHGGTIDLKSKINEGTEVDVCLPIYRV